MRNCPVAQDARCDTSPAGGPPSDYRISGMMESDVSSKQTRKSYLEVKINGNVCHALLDTGSYVTVLPRYLVTGCLIRLTKHRVRVLNKTTVPVQGEVLALIETPKFKSAAVGVVSECINRPVLGIDWICDNVTSWNAIEGYILLAGHRHEMISRDIVDAGAPLPLFRWARRSTHAVNLNVPLPQKRICLF